MRDKSRNPEQSRRADRWHLYILLCSDGSYYAGITPNVPKRLELHNSAKGPKYTRDHLPVRLVYSKRFRSKSEARKREIQIKGWTRKKKDLLIKGVLE